MGDDESVPGPCNDFQTSVKSYSNKVADADIDCIAVQKTTCLDIVLCGKRKSPNINPLMHKVAKTVT